MAADGVLSELSACECPVCYLLLEDDRAPMSLPCGHTLCQLCLDAITQKERKGPDPIFRCPLCRKDILRSMVSMNITLKSLIDEILKKTSKKGHILNIPFSEIHVGRSLDRGAFGEVYHGIWRDNEVAIKIFGFGEMSPKALLSFRKEVFVMNCLRHPNVVLMMGACQTPPKLAILMEFVPGGSLYKLLHVDNVSLEVANVCRLGCDVCRGLQYLHSINILHRDMKSKNVLLTAPSPSGQAKLCDFGLARVRQESATMTGSIGTVHWTAPEVLSNQRYQFSADVYGLGMVIYEMISGKIPFHNLIPVAVMMAVAINKQQPDMPIDYNSSLVDIVKRCLCWDAKERPSVADVLNTLSDLLPKPVISETTVESSFVHSESLGIVFLPVTDSTEFGVEEIDDDEINYPSSTTNVTEETFYHHHQQQQQHQSLHYPNQGAPLHASQQHQKQPPSYLPTHPAPPPSHLPTHPAPLQSQLENVFKTHHMLQIEQKNSEQASSPDMEIRSLSSMEGANVGAARDALFAQLQSSDQMSSPDEEVALQLSIEERDIVTARDAELAQQLQMRENSYMKPSDTIPRVQPVPMQNELQKSAKTKKLMKTRIHQSPQTPSPLAGTPPSLPLPTGYDHINQRKLLNSIQRDGLRVSKDLNRVVTEVKTGVDVGHVVESAPPPAPPPPPPIIPQGHKTPSSENSVLKKLGQFAHRIHHTLRPVSTVEKRPFRVGRVVDGSSSDKYNFTMQNYIKAYNHKLLRKVETREYPPPYPVGKVVESAKRKGKKVSQIKSHFESAPKQPPSFIQRQPSRIKVKKEVVRLNAAGQSMPSPLQKELLDFNVDDLDKVDVKEKQVLPTAEDIHQAKRELEEQAKMLEKYTSEYIKKMAEMEASGIKKRKGKRGRIGKRGKYRKEISESSDSEDSDRDNVGGFW